MKWLTLLATLSLAGCGGGSTTSPPPPPPPPTASITSVSVAPQTITLTTGATQQFTATVTGTGNFSNAVTWSVTGLGTISQTGLYTTDPNTPGTPFVTATSVEDTTKAGTANLTVTAAAVGLGSWHGHLVPNNGTASLPMDFDMTQTGTSIKSGPVLVIPDSNTSTGTCFNFSLTQAEGSQSALTPQPNVPLPGLTGTVNGQNVTLSYAPYEFGVQPIITMTGTMSVDSAGLGVITGTYTSAGINCFGGTSTSGTFTLNQFISVYSTPFKGTFNTVAVSLFQFTLSYAQFSGCPASSVDLRHYETAGRYFHQWGDGTAPGSNLVVWGVVVDGAGTQFNAYIVGSNSYVAGCFDPGTPLNATMTKQ